MIRRRRLQKENAVVQSKDLKQNHTPSGPPETPKKTHEAPWKPRETPWSCEGVSGRNARTTMGQGISEVNGRPNIGRTSMGQGISKVKVARISQAGNVR